MVCKRVGGWGRPGECFKREKDETESASVSTREHYCYLMSGLWVLAVFFSDDSWDPGLPLKFQTA